MVLQLFSNNEPLYRNSFRHGSDAHIAKWHSIIYAFLLKIVQRNKLPLHPFTFVAFLNSEVCHILWPNFHPYDLFPSMLLLPLSPWFLLPIKISTHHGTSHFFSLITVAFRTLLAGKGVEFMGGRLVLQGSRYLSSKSMLKNCWLQVSVTKHSWINPLVGPRYMLYMVHR